jgi:hypothetical protein
MWQMKIRDDLAQQYDGMSDEELLRLSLNPEQLTPDASTVLKDVLTRRRLNSVERLQAFCHQEDERKEEQRKETGKLFLLHPWGIGRARFGKAESTYDSQTQVERFKTTVFVLILWLPLIPTGTFLVERKRSFLPNDMTVLERLPLDWEQVMRVWVVTAGSLLALIWGWKLFWRVVIATTAHT